MTSEDQTTARPDEDGVGTATSGISATTAVTPEFSGERFSPITTKHLDDLPQLQRLSSEERFSMRVVSSVLPFRSNRYLIDNLIDWDNIPGDPVYQITFPQRGCWKTRISIWWRTC